MITRGETINMQQNPVQATAARNALVRALYSNLFNWVVESVNAAMDKAADGGRLEIGVLDIYGFEVGRQAVRQAGRHTGRQAHRHTGRQAAGMQAGRYAGRYAGR